MTVISKRSIAPVLALSTFFLASRAVMIFVLPPFLSDSAHYFDIARHFEAGLMPYRDFEFEYPPLALIPMYLPTFAGRIFGDGSFAFYRMAHVAIYAAVDCTLFFFFAYRALVSRGFMFGAVVYAVGGLMMAELIYDRLDLLLGASVLCAVICAMDGRAARSGAALVTGAFFKLVPLALAPLFALSEWRMRTRQHRYVWAASAICVLASGLLACGLGFGASVLSFLKFHRLRGIQIESIWSSAEWAASLLAPERFPFPGLTLGYGAMHLNSAGIAFDIVSNWASICAIGAVAWLGAACKQPPSLARLVLLGSVSWITFGKVLSPQYLLWPLCLVPICAFDLRDRRDSCFVAFFITAIALTGFEFHHYMELIAMDTTVWTAVLIRNISLIACCVSLAISLPKSEMNQSR